jgi:hypothetical protein
LKTIENLIYTARNRSAFARIAKELTRRKHRGGFGDEGKALDCGGDNIGL